MPRGAPAGTDNTAGSLAFGTRYAWLGVIPLATRTNPLLRLPDPVMMLPLESIFTACAGSKSDGTNSERLFTVEYIAIRYSYRRPRSRLSLRLIFHESA